MSLISNVYVFSLRSVSLQLEEDIMLSVDQVFDMGTFFPGNLWFWV